MAKDLIDEIGDFVGSLFGMKSNAEQGAKNFNAAVAGAVAPPPIPDLPPKAKKTLEGIDRLSNAEIREIALYMDAAFVYVMEQISGAVIAATYGGATPYVAGAVGVCTTLWERLSDREKAAIAVEGKPRK